jgi:glycosyltransferase involved in cell wall biosynthesis
VALGSEIQPTVALYSGVVVEGDAISTSLRRKLGALRKQRERLGIDVVAYCHHTDVADPGIEVVEGGAVDLLGRESFQRARAHVFEFGIHYRLFDIANLLPSESMAAVYHNVTPRDLVHDRLSEAAIDRSLDQKHLLARMSHIACVSEFNRADLVEFGIPPQRLSVMPLPPSVEAAPPDLRSGRSATGPVRLLYVGRFVRAKGVLDLLEAAERLVAEGEHRFELRMVGMAEWSDPAIVETLAEHASAGALSSVLRFTPDLPTEQLEAAYREADVFVIPSYHEGYCVPVVEAFTACCPVIAYDNSNLPSVCGGLARLVPTGDVDQLVSAIRESIRGLLAARSLGGTYDVAVAQGAIPEPVWRSAAIDRVKSLSSEHDRSFVSMVSGLLGGAGRGSVAYP